MESIEVFTEYLDSIYYQGYAEQLASENPQAFTFELNQFFDNYNFKNHEPEQRHISEGNKHYSIAA